MCAISLTRHSSQESNFAQSPETSAWKLGGVGRKGRWKASGTADWHLPPRMNRSPYADSGGSFVTRIDFGTPVAVVRVKAVMRMVRFTPEIYRDETMGVGAGWPP
jgi:hypothetical protein